MMFILGFITGLILLSFIYLILLIICFFGWLGINCKHGVQEAYNDFLSKNPSLKPRGVIFDKKRMDEINEKRLEEEMRRSPIDRLFPKK